VQTARSGEEAPTIIDGNAHEDTGVDPHLTRRVVLEDLLVTCTRLRG
jgi:hypothetical protein